MQETAAICTPQASIERDFDRADALKDPTGHG